MNRLQETTLRQQTRNRMASPMMRNIFHPRPPRTGIEQFDRMK